MSEGVVVYLMPIAFYKGTHKQKKRRLRLMEIGNQHLYNLILIAWSNDNLGTRMKYIKTMSIHPCCKALQRCKR